MDKRIKWGIIVLVGAGLTALGIHTFTPGENKELAAAEKKSPVDKNKALNVNAKIIKPHLLTDQLFVSGKLMPDEEVDLSFETSGKITSIEFTEGSFVSKGQLLAKVNDSQLQAQLKRLEAQMPLAEDRVFRQNALLQRDAVSKEAYEQVKTELATLNADIENVKANIAMTELRAPFDGIIGLRQVSLGAYASPTTVIAKLTKITPLKVEFAVPERYARQIQKGTGDILGAIAGESGMPGRMVGSIDMFDNYTFVEVPREHADVVLQAMRGAKIKGKNVHMEKANRK